MAQAYLEEIVTYGGLFVTRGDMIQHLTCGSPLTLRG